MIPTAYDLAATEPVANSTGEMLNDPARMQRATEALKSVSPRMPTISKPNLNVPATRLEGMQEMLAGSPKYASNGRASNGIDVININPNADNAYFFHEIGHLASREGKFGGLVRAARDNPQLTKALGAARYVLPLGISAALPGDDDLAQSIVASYLTAAPTIIDEALATNKGLDIMKRAGEKAKPIQRARLAGAMLSYLGAPLLAGVASNFAGNLMDDEVAERYY